MPFALAHFQLLLGKFPILGVEPGDLVTSLRETGEKILLPYPIRQPARSREFAFAVTATPERMLELGIVL